MNGNRRALYNFSQCQAIDKLSQEAGIPEAQLMAQAATASLYALESFHYEAQGACPIPFASFERVFILCGPGNNGGDGLALAYMLASYAKLHPCPAVYIYHCRPQNITSPAALFYAKLLQQCSPGPPPLPIEDFLARKEAFSEKDLLIEALLGTGQKGRPRAAILEALLAIRTLRSGQPKLQTAARLSSAFRCPALISLDIPAGLTEESPASWLPPASMMSHHRSRAKEEKNLLLAAPDEIHCYGVDKLALRLSPSLSAYSHVRLLPIGFDPTAADKIPIDYSVQHYQYEGQSSAVFSQEQKSLFVKDPLGHKYDAGHGLIIGASRGMEGALLMAARAFFASGGGILHALVPHKESRILLSQTLPSVMFYDADKLPSHIKPACILIGPGLHKEDLPMITEKLHLLLQNDPNKQPYFLLDATAIALAMQREQIRSLALNLNKCIALPHSGEWQKIMGGEAVKDSLSLYKAMDYIHALVKQGRAPAHVCLKNSIVACLSCHSLASRSQAVLYPHPNAALSAAGSGDHLAGILLALFSKKTPVPQDKSQAFYSFVQTRMIAALHLLHSAAIANAQGLHINAEGFASAVEASLLSHESCSSYESGLRGGRI